MALGNQLMWPVMVLIDNCYAQQPNLIHFNWSCVFVFVGSAVASCRCFPSLLKERSAALYLTGESRLQAPLLLSDGTVYFKAVLFLTYGLLIRGHSAHFQIRLKFKYVIHFSKQFSFCLKTQHLWKVTAPYILYTDKNVNLP